jgi:hypothetical protein
MQTWDEPQVLAQHDMNKVTSVTFFVPDVLREELVQPHRLSIGPGGVLLSGAWIMPEVTLKSLNQVQHWKRRFAY